MSLICIKVRYLLIVCSLLNFIDGRSFPSKHKYDRNFNIQESQLSHEDLAITVKTTKKNHYTRLIDILDTWFEEAPSNTYVITDLADKLLDEKLNGRLIGTNCGQGHNHHSLNCKFQKELEVLTQINAKWSCHFDDDNYVNIPQLLKILAQYDSNKLIYLGRPTLDGPINIDNVEFVFSTGGAGICISRPLLHRIYPYIKKFEKLTPGFIAPDDVTFGYLITAILQVPLTIEPSFHSHLHQLDSSQLKNLHKQATLGPMDSIRLHLNPMNKNDQQLFYTLDCHIFPNKCQKVGKQLLNR